MKEGEWERVSEWEQGESVYLLRVSASEAQVELELEEKWSGELWQAGYSAAAIEELTEKARNRKKYSVFLSMLRSALERTRENLFIEILSYREIALKTLKGRAPAAVPPEQASKRFLILNYNIDFEKIQFPIALRHTPDPPPERTRLTLRRIAALLATARAQHTPSELERENAFLKYELDALRATQRPSIPLPQLQTKLEELQRELSERGRQLEESRAAAETAQREREAAERNRDEALGRLRASEERVCALQLRVRELQGVERAGASEQRLEVLIRKMEKLGKELIFAQEKERKSEIKIATLERELQAMQKTQQKPTLRPQQQQRNTLRYSEDERELSVRSGRSNNSNNSRNSNKSNSKKNSTVVRGSAVSGAPNTRNDGKRKVSGKKPSVYDSDTESSRLRRLNNGRSSPYRQASPKRQTRPAQERGRSKSREQAVSPKPSNIDSQLYSEAVQSDDSEQRFEKLKEQLGRPGKAKKAAGRVAAHQTALESKMESLEEMIRKVAQATRDR